MRKPLYPLVAAVTLAVLSACTTSPLVNGVEGGAVGCGIGAIFGGPVGCGIGAAAGGAAGIVSTPPPSPYYYPPAYPYGYSPYYP